eukprot:7431640-Pyramimonas_sp.AAC.1
MLHGLGDWTCHRDCLIASEKNWKQIVQITRCTYGSMSHGFVPWGCWFAQGGDRIGGTISSGRFKVIKNL